MIASLRSLLIGALFVSCVDAAAGWVRRYEKIEKGHASAIAPLPGGRALVYAEGFQRTLFTVNEKGDVIAARRVRDQASFIATGEGGEIFVGFVPLSKRGDRREDLRQLISLMRLNDDLSPRWSRTLKLDGDDRWIRIFGAHATRDGGLLLAGRIGNGSYVVRLRESGEIQWRRVLDPSGEDRFNSIYPTRDGGAICVGESRAGPWLVKLDSEGKVRWHQTYPSGGTLKNVIETAQREIIAVGEYRKSALVIRTGADGTARWQKSIEGLGAAYGLQPIGEGRFVLAANDAAHRTIFVEMNSEGVAGWRKRIDPPPSLTMVPRDASSLAVNSDAIYFAPGIVGGLDDAVYVFRIDSGASDCGWVVHDPATSVIDLSLPAETFDLESADLPLLAEMESRTKAPSPVSLSHADVACNVAEAAPVRTPTARISEFRGSIEEEERKRHYHELLLAKEYDRLEELVAKFRREHTRQDPMWWEIGYFYEALVTDDSVSTEERLGRLRAWAEARPQSTVPRIALARALYEAAWRQRGSGYADTVTDKGWSGYAKLIEEATHVLEGLGHTAEDDTRYWTLLIDVVHETGSGDIREIARAAAAKGHHNPSIYQAVAHYLHPRWGGSGAEYRAFAEEAARLTRATFGEGMYTWLAYQASVGTEEDEYATEYAFDWERMKRGFEDIIKLNPAWLPSYHRYAAVASRFEDRRTARDLFQRPELDWYVGAESMWRGGREMYDRNREWALRTPIEAFMEARPSTIKASSFKPVSVAARAGDRKHWPPIVMQGAHVSDTAHRMSAFFVKSANGVFAVSAMPFESDLRDDVNAILRGWRRTLQWSFWPPANAKAKMSVSSIATPSPANRQQGVALMLTPSSPKPLVHVLTASPSDRKHTSRALYVVGCHWIETRCEQFVAEGSLGTYSVGKYAHFTIGLHETYPDETFAGSPVLDEDGYVIGVATHVDGSRMVRYAQLITADYLSTVLPATTTSETVVPLMRMPFATWPPIVMQSEIVLHTATHRRIGSFLVDTPSGVVAVSVVPGEEKGPKDNFVQETSAGLRKWTMWSPAHPRNIFTARLETSNPSRPGQRGVALALDGVRDKLPVRPLTPATSNRIDVRKPVFVVGCVWSPEGKCNQKVVEGRVASGSLDPQKRWSIITIQFDKALEPDAFVGGAVLDEDGLLVGVLRDRSYRVSSSMHLRDADGIGFILP